MLQKPDLADETLMKRLRGAYGLPVVQVTFLELGGDLRSAVYRVTAEDGEAYFCKLRRGVDDDTAAHLTTLLHGQGVVPIIHPLMTLSNEPSTGLGVFSLSLYPFVEGVSGYEVELSAAQWAEFGTAFRRIHSAPVPPAIARKLSKEQYSAEWRQRCATVMAHVEGTRFDDQLSLELQQFLRSKRDMILRAVSRATELARSMEPATEDLVLCHCDIHPGNLLITDAGALFIVDWDYPMLAPKERDLMFVGGGQGFKPYVAERERQLFYSAYGTARSSQVLLTYYRYERGLTEVTVECERVLSTSLSDGERRQALTIVQLYFLPGCTLEIAHESDQASSRC